MYLTDLRKEFFDVVITNRVLVLVNSDVDGVCATKILQYLFKCDNVLYSLVPVRGKKDFYSAYRANIEGVKHVVLLNCGATVDICEFLDPDDDIIFYVLDNHRPVDVTNIYNDGQVRLMMKQDVEEQIPQYDDIFRDDESDSEDEEDEFGEKRKRYDEESLLRRREKREWEAKRKTILFNYERDSYFSSSSALYMYELAWKMSRDNNDLLWWAIIGHTYLYLHNKIEDDRYLTDNGILQNHVSRLNRGENETMAVDCLKIQAESELNLTLYRHWTVSCSLRHTPYTAAKFKTFSLKGEHRLREFLADAGLPLQQCNQNYQSMDLLLRQDLVPSFTGKAEKYGLDDLTYSSFNCSFGFRHKYCALDMVHCLQAVVEHRGLEEDSTTPFLEALDTLARTRTEKLEIGLKMARNQLEIIVKQIQNVLDTKQVVSAGPFLYVIIQEGTPMCQYLCRPSTVTHLAQFLLAAHVSCSHSRKVASLPLVLVTPLDAANGLSVVVGVPPVDDRNRKNFMGKAFEQAVINTGSRYLLDYWDSNIIQIKTEDRTKFLDGLIAIMSQ